MASHASPCTLARCLMPPYSHSPAPTLGRAPRGTVTPAAMVLRTISPVLQPASATIKEPESELESPPSSPAVRMCTWSKALISTETTLGQRQWPLWPPPTTVRPTPYFRAHRTHRWTCRTSVGLIIEAGRWRRASRFLTVLSPFTNGTCAVSSGNVVAC